ncbi:hypothetical protein RCO28_02515 [Streptomyces sp. LHD-70]|uniref:hypothetical protein n=1 Tax=Streptomyces sp. LHD-70 TaxID=3072140 RepID=UPI00280F1741|nr:hypothetical protein [Streptomyces sp. LHD-70]MDQ8701362.1 hypothetical protein [Streptomyces sp. LHD-70]
MTTREELHALLDRVPDDDLPVLAERLRELGLLRTAATGPKSLGMGNSGHTDTSERADEILRESGFGE